MIVRGLLNNRLLIGQVGSRRFLSRSSQKPRPDAKHYRLWSIPGDDVCRKEVLAKQWTMKWHPGLNVGIDENRTIYALCDGVMVISEEKFDPDWDNSLVKKVYQVEEEKRAPDYVRYIHVIPNHRVPEFKLVDLV